MLRIWHKIKSALTLLKLISYIISIVLSIHLLRSSYYVRLLFCAVDIVERQLVSSQFGDFLAEAVGATSKFSVNKKRNTQYSVEMHKKISIISLNRIYIADFS